MQIHPFNPTEQNRFDVCRVLQGCALITVASFNHLKEAKK